MNPQVILITPGTYRPTNFLLIHNVKSMVVAPPIVIAAIGSIISTTTELTMVATGRVTFLDTS